ncbi:MAG: hypothetical protein JW910_18400, partial [Anaerolineae bacterium]|nr:hypothetical protein [Anaerolineae bacterium]
MLSGKGMFLWQVWLCEQGNAERLVSLARAAGLTHVILLLSDGVYDFPRPVEDTGGAHEALTGAAIDAFRRARLQVWALAHTQGTDPAMEAHRAAGRVRRWRLDGVVINPQQGYTGQHAHARQFIAALRQDLGTDSEAPLVALSLYRNPDTLDPSQEPLTSRFPVDEFAAVCDLLMPQVFWVARDGGDPAAALQINYAQYARRYPGKPYV